MKPMPTDEEEESRAKGIAEQCWLGPICLLFWVIVVVAVLLLTGCTVTIGADGSKSATIDAPTFARFAEIYADK